MDAAQVVSEAGRVDCPEAVAVAPMLPGPFSVTVEYAYEAVKKLLHRDLDYAIRFLDDDGAIIRRFSRATPCEAWLMACPVDGEGRPLAGEDRVLMPIAIDVIAISSDERGALAASMMAELDRLKAADHV